MKRILIVDGEPLIRYSLEKLLKNYNVEVKAAKNGAEALVEINACFYDICFLDLWLPDSYGIDILKRIKETYPMSKVMVMSSSPISEETRDILDKEAYVFIAKPFDLPRIRSLVKQLLEECEQQRAEVDDGDKTFMERRRFERRPFARSITYSVSSFDVLKPKMVDLDAEIVDISAAGMGIRTDYPLDPGSVIRFPVIGDGINSIAGVVKNTVALDRDLYRAGIEFV
ncbi:MAG: response regulator [Nitrospirota bacterium]